MIGYFPDPYPDELFYSLCARFTDRMQYSSRSAVTQELFGHLKRTAIVDLPLYLETFVTNLPLGHTCKSVEKLIDQHTLLPFYGPFLFVERLNQIRENMRTDNTSSPYQRAGMLVNRIPRPDWLQFCPQCVADDRHRFNECYWHRVHQIPGVRICSTHEVPLEKSGVRSWNSKHHYSFISAECAIQAMPSSTLETTPGHHETLLYIAREAAWLLKQPDLTVAPASLRQRYRALLIERGLASYSGIVKAQKFQDAFQSHHSDELLRVLHCELADHIRLNWLRRLLHIPDKFSHPLRHLLLINFLGHTVETFLQCPLEYRPFGEAPWPCLNLVSDHYQHLTIESCQITYDTLCQPCGTFTCPLCEFSYLRKGPDRSVEDRFRIGQYLSPGPVWEAKLRQLWADPTISQVEAARQFNVDAVTIARQGVRLGLSFPPPGSTMKQPKISIPQRLSPTHLNEYRTQWLTVLTNHPNASRTTLQQIAPKLHRWLWRYDHQWLDAHMPPPKNPGHSQTKPTPPRVNWAERDTQLAQQVTLAAQRLKNKPGRPVWISVEAIGREVSLVKRLKGQWDKLPLTSQALAKVTETRVMAAVRRVEWAAACYRQEGHCPFRSHLAQRAGVRQSQKHPEVREAIEQALQMLSQNAL